jgi:TolB-like protein
MMLDDLTTATSRPPDPAAYAFGRFLLSSRRRLLLRDGEPVELGSRAFEVLLELLAADGALLTKKALLDRVWPGVIVDENNLQVQVSALRRVLGPKLRGWITTIPGRGYRFTGPVAVVVNENGDAAPANVAPEPAAVPPPMSVLVLPFAARGDDPARSWFADAVTDGLTTDLARALPLGSAVAAQATADTYRDHHADVRAIGREQGVRYLVEGSVLVVDARVRINAQLIAVETGAHLWADRFDVPWHDDGDVLQAQDDIIGRLSYALGQRMADAEVRRAEQSGRDLAD